MTLSRVIYLDEAVFDIPQIRDATSILDDWWKSKLCGLGISHRATTENATAPVWDFGFPTHSTIDRIDEIFECLGIVNYDQAKQILIEFDSAVFDYPIPSMFMDGMEGKAAKFWAISATHALDSEKPTYTINLGWYDFNETRLSAWNEETFDAAGRDWFNSRLPGNVEDYSGFPGVEEIKYTFYKDNGNMRSAKFYGDYRNILFNCETDPWTHLTEGNLEVCTSSPSNRLFQDTTNLVSEIIAANTGTWAHSSGRNNSENTYLRIMPSEFNQTFAQESEDIPTDLFMVSETEMQIEDPNTNEQVQANVEIYMDVSNGGYVVGRLRNHYANGVVSEWYSANSVLDARIV